VDGIMQTTAWNTRWRYPVTTEIHFRDPEFNRLLSAFYDVGLTVEPTRADRKM